MNINFLYPFFRLDALSGFVGLFILFFSLLISVYSLRSMRGKANLFLYYGYLVLTAVASLAAVLANNLLVLLIAWGFLGLTLFLLMNIDGAEASRAAKKTFIIVGGSDSLMLLGIAIIYYLSGTYQMDKISLSLSSGSWQLASVAYLCLAIACFAKAGAMPFHSWIPDCARYAPVPVVAYLPASLDKLLGIYLLARISLDLFLMNQAMNLLLMVIGAFTIIAAVMMALVQHNLKRLLGYHAVSQVGYMVLGIGTGNPIGIAGGIFHMLNHAIYKSCLFLTAGNVEQKANTTQLDRLGGLSKLMPLTYITCLIASLSISGVPPFNGFVSKWMVYQGLISSFQLPASSLQKLLSVFCLAAAMFGSGLTLASFMKLIHATFLGQPADGQTGKRANEVSWSMWLPPLSLAVLCIAFGVFAFQIPLRYFIFPALNLYYPALSSGFLGVWSSDKATWLMIIGLLLGLLIFKLGRQKRLLRQDSSFLGAETASLGIEARVSGVEFYNSVKELKLLARIYKLAEKQFFDIYHQAERLIFSLTGFLRYLHNGILPTYIVWCLLGMMAMFFILFRL